MSKRLLVGSLVVAALVLLTACASGSSNHLRAQSAPSGLVELGVASTTKTDARSTDSMPLDAELECSGGGHLQYGLVPTPAAK